MTLAETNKYFKNGTFYMASGEDIYNGIIPQKTSEYLQLQLPIVFIGSPESEVAQIVKYTDSGFSLDLDYLTVADFNHIIDNIHKLKYQNIEEFDFDVIFQKALSRQFSHF